LALFCGVGGFVRNDGRRGMENNGQPFWAAQRQGARTAAVRGSALCKFLVEHLLFSLWNAWIRVADTFTAGCAGFFDDSGIPRDRAGRCMPAAPIFYLDSVLYLPEHRRYNSELKHLNK